MAGRWWSSLPVTAGLLVASLDPACAQTAPVGPAVLAVESLRPALEAIVADWKTGGGKPASVTYAAASAMGAQLAGAAPADIVMSDDAAAMDALVKSGLLVAQTRRNIIGDDLVLVAPVDAAVVLKIASGFDLAGAVGDGGLALCASCPAGRLAQQSLEALKVWPAVQPKLARTSDGAATLAMVERGEARLGIVFAAEAKADAKVKALDVFPASTYEAVRYAVALVKTSRSPEAAAFIAALRSARSTRILRSLGYAVLR